MRTWRLGLALLGSPAWVGAAPADPGGVTWEDGPEPSPAPPPATPPAPPPKPGAHPQSQIESGGYEEVVVEIPRQAGRVIDQKGFAARPYLLEARGGFFGIVGLVGVTAGRDLGRMVVGGGVGLGVGGWQMAAYARARPVVFKRRGSMRLHALGVEVAYSTGGYTQCDLGGALMADGPDRVMHWDWVHWVQPAIAWEMRNWKGFSLLTGVGVAIPVARSGYHCWRDTAWYPCGRSLYTMPSVTVALGHAWAGSN